MKNFIYFPFVVLIIFSCLLNVTFSKILVHKDDVIIADYNGAMKCDHIVCPRNTFHCRVLKATDLSNPHILRRTSTCYAKDGTVLFQSQKATALKRALHVYLDVTANRDGLIITNEEVKKGFHFSTKNIAALKGKVPGYIKDIEETIEERHAFVAKNMASLWEREA